VSLLSPTKTLFRLSVSRRSSLVVGVLVALSSSAAKAKDGVGSDDDDDGVDGVDVSTSTRPAKMFSRSAVVMMMLSRSSSVSVADRLEKDLASTLLMLALVRSSLMRPAQRGRNIRCDVFESISFTDASAMYTWR